MRHGSRLLAPLVTGLAVLLAGTLPVGPAAAATVDTTGPVVDTVSYSPGTLDLDSDQRSVHVSIVVTDASGIELDGAALATFRSLGTTQTREALLDPAPGSTATRVVYEGDVEFAADSARGQWALEVDAPTDIVGNAAGPAPSTPLLTTTGTGTGDVVGPAVTSLTFSPASLDLTSGELVRVRMVVTDDAITGYTVTSSPGGLTANVTGTSATLSGLTNGTAYTFAVTATNPVGRYRSLRSSTAVTPATLPGSPSGVAAVRGDASATVSWTPPVSNGGSPITGYTVTTNPGGATRTVSTTSTTVIGLTNGTSYTFTVTAINAVGISPASEPSAAVVPATTPGAPTAVSAVAGNSQTVVSWTPPASNGGSPITGYTVTTNPGGATRTVSTTSTTVTGLTNGTSYTFTVTAANAVGNSPASEPSAAITPTAPVVDPPPVEPPPSQPGTSSGCVDAQTAVASAQAAVASAKKKVATLTKRLSKLKKAKAPTGKLRSARSKLKKGKKTLRIAQGTLAASVSAQGTACSG